MLVALAYVVGFLFQGGTEEIVFRGRQVRKAGMKLFVTVILGLAGPERSRIHARETARALSELDPDYVGALSLMLVPGTSLYRDWERGSFELPSQHQILDELRAILQETAAYRAYFARTAPERLV